MSDSTLNACVAAWCHLSSPTSIRLRAEAVYAMVSVPCTTRKASYACLQHATQYSTAGQYSTSQYSRAEHDSSLQHSDTALAPQPNTWQQLGALAAATAHSTCAPRHSSDRQCVPLIGSAWSVQRNSTKGLCPGSAPHLFLSSRRAICTHSLGPTLLLSLLNTTCTQHRHQDTGH